MQVIQHRYYTTLSNKNSINLVPIPPRRGLIYDRNGVLLAENIPVYSLIITPSDIKNLPDTINRLQKIIPITATELEAFNKQVKQHRPFDQVPLKLKLTEQQVARFDVNQYQFPGVAVKAQLIRHYPLSQSFAHTVGYVGRINQQELAKLDQNNYAGTNFIGKTGIENYYEDLLHGKVGYERIEVNASGREVRSLGNTPAQAGQNIYLTIDSGLQQTAQKALGDNNGAVVVIQAHTGQVLAMVSNPSFDPDLFVDGISDKQYEALLNDKNQPLYNRTIRGLYPSGSTVKPMLALQALDTGTITPDFTIDDHGYYKLPHSSHIYHDWKVGGHGIVDVTKAIQQSCDTFFYKVGHMMGIANIDNIMGRFGFGQKTGIDLPNELAGTVPSPEWKLQHYQTEWYPGDTVITSIGQGYTQVTALQLADEAAALGMRGKRFKPYLLYATQNADGKKTLTPATPLTPVTLKNDQYWDIVINAMHQVVSADGTAWRFGIPKNYTAAAKPGTAQVSSIRFSEDYSHVPPKLRPDSWFIVFAPVNNPQIGIAVLAEHHPGGSAPIARKVADYYFSHLSEFKKNLTYQKDN